jgi:hypothetical protein
MSQPAYIFPRNIIESDTGRILEKTHHLPKDPEPICRQMLYLPLIRPLLVAIADGMADGEVGEVGEVESTTQARSPRVVMTNQLKMEYRWTA